MHKSSFHTFGAFFKKSKVLCGKIFFIFPKFIETELLF